MDAKLTQYLKEIGGRGGRKSRRKLSSETARNMVRLREARRAYRDFHTSCFWSFDPAYVITADDIPWIIEHLRGHGGRAGWEKAAWLSRQLGQSPDVAMEGTILPMKDADGFHSLMEARSFALHEEVASRLIQRPELVVRAQQRVESWLARPAEHPYAADWQTLLLLPVDQLQASLTDRHERMCTLRQASPFAGALDAQTRWKILKRPELRPRETR